MGLQLLVTGPLPQLEASWGPDHEPAFPLVMATCPEELPTCRAKLTGLDHAHECTAPTT